MARYDDRGYGRADYNYDRPDRRRYARDDDYERDERGFFDRAADEVRSWFGDDEAERRRERDERYDEMRDRGEDSYDRRYGGSGSRGYDRVTTPRRSEYYDRGPSRRSDYGRSDYDEGNEFGVREYVREQGRGASDRSYGDRSYGDRSYGDRSERSGQDYRSTGPYGGGTYGGRAYESRTGGQDDDHFGERRGTSMRGRGPQGYSRKKERIEEEVCELLTDDDFLDASGIRVSVEDGEVTLEGTVPDRASKRRAERLAEEARGVRDVHNRLRVQSERSGTGSTGTGSTGTGSAGTGSAGAGSAGAGSTGTGSTGTGSTGAGSMSGMQSGSTAASGMEPGGASRGASGHTNGGTTEASGDANEAEGKAARGKAGKR